MKKRLSSAPSEGDQETVRVAEMYRGHAIRVNRAHRYGVALPPLDTKFPYVGIQAARSAIDEMIKLMSETKHLGRPRKD